MDLNETMVENEVPDTAADDTLPEGIEEETDESEESLESATEEQAPAEPAPEQTANEPGYIRKRIDKAVQKAVAETEARMQALFDQQMAPIRERMLNEEARELVRQGEFKSLDRAKEYLQLKQGIQPKAEPKAEAQPRNDQGQFAPKEDPQTSARIDLLAHQASKIKANKGIDVMAEFNNNEEIKQKVLSGEMDFYDVAEQLGSGKRKPPAPTRSPNGASGQNANAISTMSDEQFARLEKRIKEGARIRLT